MGKGERAKEIIPTKKCKLKDKKLLLK